jgi:hypothetical protein
MAHLNQIDVQAIYDDERRQLRITGTTDFSGPPQPDLVAIHFTIKQSEAPDDVSAYTKLPYRCLNISPWMARFGGDFEGGPATLSGLAVTFEPDTASLVTQVWSQTIQVTVGALDDEDTDMDRFYPRSAKAAAMVP